MPHQNKKKININVRAEQHVNLQQALSKEDELIGKRFNYKGFEFIALATANRNQGILSISADVIDTRIKFADNNDRGSNDWKKSYLRKYLNNELIKSFDINDFLPIKTDLTADTGETDYGSCEDTIAIPNDNILRTYHSLIPNYKTWIWSATPWAINYSTMSAVSARTQSKTIYSEQPNKELGVAIVCVFKKDLVAPSH